MHREGHIGMALLVYAPGGFLAALIGGTELAFVGAAVVAGLSMVPDIDMRIPFVKHRGITHTVWTVFVVGVGLGIVGLTAGLQQGLLPAIGLWLFGTFIGAAAIGSHLLADALTPAGVTPFVPRSEVHISYSVARASNLIANYSLLGLGGGTFLVFIMVANALR